MKESLEVRLSKLSPEERKKKIEDVIDIALGVIESDNIESVHYAILMRNVISKKYGVEAINYMDKRLVKGPLGYKGEKPTPYYPK